MPKRDFSQVAFDVVQRATREVAVPPAKTVRQVNSSKGGLKGGAARASKLSAEQRTEIAKKAAQGRWSKS